jgi:hypothetical protein
VIAPCEGPTVAGIVSPAEHDFADYVGIGAIFEYTNGDGALTHSNCGQAAAATFLTHHGRLLADAAHASRVMAALERCHPPNVLGGLFGTSRRRVARICAAFGVPVRELTGEAALRASLARREPVIVMLGVSAGRWWRFDLPGGHWMVAYACDAGGVYLTNWGKMTWDEFRRGWDALVPHLIGMRRRGLAARGGEAQPAGLAPMGAAVGPSPG